MQKKVPFEPVMGTVAPPQIRDIHGPRSSANCASIELQLYDLTTPDYMIFSAREGCCLKRNTIGSLECEPKSRELKKGRGQENNGCRSKQCKRRQKLIMDTGTSASDAGGGVLHAARLQTRQDRCTQYAVSTGQDVTLCPTGSNDAH